MPLYRETEREMRSDTMSEEPGKKEQILNHARRLFIRHGYRKTTTEDITRACGLTKTALYYYFASKEQLFAAVVWEESEGFLAKIREAVAQSNDPREQLEAAIMTRFKVIGEFLLLHDVSAQAATELVPLAEKARQQFFRAEEGLIEEILERGRSQGHFRVKAAKLVALSMISAFKGVELHFAVVQEAPSQEEGVEELIRLLFDGLCCSRKSDASSPTSTVRSSERGCS
jgi:AcrR family transcriptional regulator